MLALLCIMQQLALDLTRSPSTDTVSTPSTPSTTDTKPNTMPNTTTTDIHCKWLKNITTYMASACPQDLTSIVAYKANMLGNIQKNLKTGMKAVGNTNPNPNPNPIL